MWREGKGKRREKDNLKHDGDGWRWMAMDGDGWRWMEKAEECEVEEVEEERKSFIGCIKQVILYCASMKRRKRKHQNHTLLKALR